MHRIIRNELTLLQSERKKNVSKKKKTIYKFLTKIYSCQFAEKIRSDEQRSFDKRGGKKRKATLDKLAIAQGLN